MFLCFCAACLVSASVRVVDIDASGDAVGRGVKVGIGEVSVEADEKEKGEELEEKGAVRP